VLVLLLMLQSRPKEDQNFWNFLLSVFFVIFLVGAVWLLYAWRGSFPGSVPIFDAVLMAFAAFRITRLLVYDKIARWFRELFAERVEYLSDGLTYVEIRPLGRGVRHTIHDLLQCPWCIGFWGSLAVSWFYFMFPWAWYVIFFLALAGMGSLLQVTANLIGWKAEQLKRTIERL